LVSIKTGLQLTGLALGALAVFLIIRGAGQALKDFKLPEFPAFPTIENPFKDFKFPEFPAFPTIPNPFDEQGFFSNLQKQFDDFFSKQKDISGETFEQNGAPGMFGEETTFDKETGIIEGKPPTIDLGLEPGGLDPLGEISFNKLKSEVFRTLTKTIGLTPAKAFAQLKDLEFTKGATLADLDFVLQSFNQPIDPALLGKSAATATLPEVFDVKSFLDQPGQKFEGGGVGFIGGSVTETPIGNLSLSQLIDKFGITASQAANLKATSLNDFGDFDFGSNTGLGIGSIFKNPNLENILPQPTSNISNQSFQGLSATQIALQLTGGNIQNFA